MNRITQFLTKALEVLLAFLPSKLPATKAQFDTWAVSIFKTYSIEDKPGNRHALASLIMHLGPVQAYKPKRYFSFAIMKSLANEAAFETIQSLREAEKAYIDKHMNGAPAKVEQPKEGPTTEELRASEASH